MIISLITVAIIHVGVVMHRFFEFELTKASQQFTLDLLKCSYEEPGSVDFRPDGIIGKDIQYQWYRS